MMKRQRIGGDGEGDEKGGMPRHIVPGTSVLSQLLQLQYGSDSLYGSAPLGAAASVTPVASSISNLSPQGDPRKPMSSDLTSLLQSAMLLSSGLAGRADPGKPALPFSVGPSGMDTITKPSVNQFNASNAQATPINNNHNNNINNHKDSLNNSSRTMGTKNVSAIATTAVESAEKSSVAPAAGGSPGLALLQKVSPSQKRAAPGPLLQPAKEKLRRPSKLSVVERKESENSAETGETEQTRRKRKNDREKERRSEFNAMFDRLNQLLGLPEEAKMNKISLLATTIDTIVSLQAEIADFKAGSAAHHHRHM